MSEWWTYRPGSFLLFSARTYHRLFELHNTALWPAPVFALLLGIGLLVLVSRRGGRAAAAAWTLLGMAWLWVAWSFHLQRYATINWAATWMAAAFALQGVLLLVVGLPGRGARPGFAATGWRRAAGLGLVLIAVLLHPLVAPLAGRPWIQAEVFALAPDPTAMATVGVLLLVGRSPAVSKASDRYRPVAAVPETAQPATAPRPPGTGWLWPIPLLWCGVTGLTLWAMYSPSAWLAPALALVALLAHRWGPSSR